ncbi:hypothetical protein ABTZ03_39165 [Kitasatospora sp. NPDC096077]
MPVATVTSSLQVRLITDAGNPAAELTGLAVTITALGSTTN